MLSSQTQLRITPTRRLLLTLLFLASSITSLSLLSLPAFSSNAPLSEPASAQASIDQPLAAANQLTAAEQEQVSAQISQHAHGMAASNNQLNSGESNSLILERHFTDPYYSNGDQFGYNSAINGDTLVVSAIREDSNGDPEDNSVNNSGAIYSFQRESGNWVLKQFLKAPVPTPNAHFGYTLDLYDDVLVVGSKETFTVTGQSSGTARTTGDGVVYVFRQQNSLWELEATLKPSRPFHSDKYGSTLAVSGDTIVVGDPEEDNDGNLTPTQYRNEEYGAVYVYVWSGTDWVE